MCKCWYSVGITTQVQLPPCSVHWLTPLCRYEGSVDLNLNYRTQYDDFLYSSDAGAAERCACAVPPLLDTSQLYVNAGLIASRTTITFVRIGISISIAPSAPGSKGLTQCTGASSCCSDRPSELGG